MKRLPKSGTLTTCFLVGQVVLSLYCCTGPEQKTTSAPPAMTHEQMIAHGENLVMVGGCNDCHSPKVMTSQGLVVDSTRLLSGSPADMKLPEIDTKQVMPGKWYLGSSDLTAWVGPWGISYAANLTPDTVTGIGGWTEELFIKILRTGKFMGVEAGRPIMPPMPPVFGKVMSDQDLKCMFAYLKSLAPVKNRVHDYVPPTEIANVR